MMDFYAIPLDKACIIIDQVRRDVESNERIIEKYKDTNENEEFVCILGHLNKTMLKAAKFILETSIESANNAKNQLEVLDDIIYDTIESIKAEEAKASQLLMESLLGRGD